MKDMEHGIIAKQETSQAEKSELEERNSELEELVMVKAMNAAISPTLESTRNTSIEGKLQAGGLNIMYWIFVSFLSSCFTSRILPHFNVYKIPIKSCQPWQFSFLPQSLKTNRIFLIHF